MKAELSVLFLDDNIPGEDTRLFGADCTQGRVISDDGALLVRSFHDPREFLLAFSRAEAVEGGYNMVLAGVHVTINALLLDVDFSGSEAHCRSLLDPSESANNQDEWGIAILNTIKRMDPDFPVIVFTELSEQSLSFVAGQLSADDFVSKSAFVLPGGESDQRRREINSLLNRLRKAKSSCDSRAIYDHRHLIVADRFAPKYDVEERDKAATVAYYHFENELILAEVSRLVGAANPNERIRVLDIGCGTGRIEELLIQNANRGRFDVVAVDFSGCMLDCASAKLQKHSDRCCVRMGEILEPAANQKLHVSLFRAPAERLEFLARRYGDGFDLVLLGFGFLSYVKYGDVLPASPDRPPVNGVVPLIREGGKLLFSVYNEDSAIYARVSALQQLDKDMPIAAVMDLGAGRLQVGERFFACEAFTRSRVVRFLRQGSLTVDPDDVRTFPTVHLMLKQSDTRHFPQDPDFPTGVFNRQLYQLDKDLSLVMSERGHYVVGWASKRNMNEAGGTPL